MADYAPVDLLAAEQVAFELNGRRVTAPAGTMLVDAAFAHGVEVPIFCYEPRLGPADRGVPDVPGRGGGHARASRRPAARPCSPTWWCAPTPRRRWTARTGCWSSCSRTTRSTARSATRAASARSRTARSASAPGARRFVEPKRHFPKPLDLSSLIALDRERCISCFRCVRFSQDVAEDGALDHGGPRRRQRDRHLHRRPVRGPLHRQRHRPLPGRARSRASPTASSRGPGTSRTPRRSAATAPWAATRS